MKNKKVIKEVRGIAKSAIPYTQAVLDKLEKHIDHFFSRLTEEYLNSMRGLRKDGYLPLPDYKVEFSIPYRTLARYIDNEIFRDFPLTEIRIELKCAYVESKSPFQSRNQGEIGGDTWSVSGGAYPIYRGYAGSMPLSQRLKPERYMQVSKTRRESVERVLLGELDFDLTFYQDFNPERDIVPFERELKAVVFHEMMHLYEGYKDKSQDTRVIWKKETSRPRSKSQTSKSYLSDTKMLGIPVEIVDKMNFILHAYYNSLPTEVKAITHEMYPYVKDMEVSEFFSSYQGKRVKGLMEFDSDVFYNELIDESYEYFRRIGTDYDDVKMERFFEQVLYRIKSKYKTSAIKNHEVIDNKFLSKKTLKSLIDYMGIQINKSGQKLFKNVARLYSLKNEL